MKYHQLGCCALLLLTGSVQAQNSVVMYGVIDEGLNFTSNAGGHTAYQMHSGDMGATRWGLKGVEDLGAGYKAIFTLENGFNINTGSIQGGCRAKYSVDRHGLELIRRNTERSRSDGSLIHLSTCTATLPAWAGLPEALQLTRSTTTTPTGISELITP